jgi:hypothetical protein
LPSVEKQAERAAAGVVNQMSEDSATDSMEMLAGRL